MGTINGTNDDDQFLYGTIGNDTINALAGIDWILGSTGNDQIDGGSGGSDVVMYSDLNAGVIINNTSYQVGNVDAFSVLKSGGQQDTLIGIEAVHGTQFSDKIYMSNNTYVFAEGGNDEIRVGTSVFVSAGSGNDTIYGGTGSGLDYDGGDPILQTRGIIAIWNTATSGIVLDDGWGNTDKYFGISGISGSAFSDVMIGNIGNDQISGVAGDDYLYGNAGADAIQGGDGNDMLFGGTGDDYISGGSDEDSIYGGEGENYLDGGDGNDVYFVQSDIIASNRIDDSGGDSDIIQVLDTFERDAYRLVYDGVYLVHETMQGHRTVIALDEDGVPVVEYLQWIGSQDYGTDNYTNTLRIITDLSNITGRLIAVAGTDEDDTIVMPNETPQDGEYWGEIYANAGDDNITLSSTMLYVTYAGDGDDSVFGYGDMGDLVTGEAGNDSLDGNNGDDTLYGGEADDQLSGGDGNDLLEGGSTTDDGEDELYGGNGDDTLIAQGSNSFMEGGAGNDLITGSDGFEDLSYQNSETGVTVNLETGLAEDGFGATDTISGIDQILASYFADNLIGDDANNRFQAFEGDDTIDGAGGSDLVRYDRDFSDGGLDAITVDLAAGWATDSWGDQDTLLSIEKIRATNGNDSVTGSEADNNLQGNGGDDSLYGGGGHDTLEGGAGNDVLVTSGNAYTLNERGSFVYGGDGDDTLINSEFSSWGALLSPGLGHNSVSGSIETWEAGDGDDLGLHDLVNVGGVTVVQGINGTGTVNSGDGQVVNTFERIQFFQLTAEDDVVYFSDDARIEIVSPWEGNDTIYGGSGIDSLFYGVDIGNGISLDFLSGRVIDPWGDIDQFSAIEIFRGSQSADTMSAAGIGYAVSLEGNNGNDFIIGGNGSDTLSGGFGNDKLYSGDGNDYVDGGDGDDRFYGGKGVNIIDGGAGNDTFGFRYDGVTTLSDSSGQNWLRLEGVQNVSIARLYVNNLGSLVVEGSNGSSITINNYQSAIVGINWTRAGYSMSLADTAVGTLEDDTLRTSSASYVEAYGSDGNDIVHIDATQSSWVSGDGGSDLIHGGDGQDTIRGDWNALVSGNDTLFGGAGEDRIDGGKGKDRVFGGSGDDKLFGGEGDDTIDDGVGFDTIDGGSGVDTFMRLYDGSDYRLVFGFDLVRGLAYLASDPNSAAELFIDIENVRVSGGYTFVLTGSNADNLLETAAGNDTLYGLSGQDSLVSGAGNDSLDGGSGNDSMTGGANDDTYIVDSSTDLLVELANGGGDVVKSSAANYTLAANVESLILTGNAAINGTGNTGSNVLTGNSAANSISGGGGNDTIIGSGGNDTLEGAAGNDSLAGGDGIDTASYSRATAAVTVNLTLSTAQSTVGAGTDTIVSVENLIGSAFNDTLKGNDAANNLSGGSGNDSLIGGTGNDSLVSGEGADTMNGGAGNDAFIFNNLAESGTTATVSDVITDFVRGQDKIDLRDIDAFVSSSTNDAFVWKETAAFSSTTQGEVRYQKFDNAGSTNDYTMVWIDNDADTDVEMAIRLTGLYDLQAADFML